MSWIVYIDTMSPDHNISPENVTIKRGTAYVDTGVTIFDNDPTYNGLHVSSNVRHKHKHSCFIPHRISCSI